MELVAEAGVATECRSVFALATAEDTAVRRFAEELAAALRLDVDACRDVRQLVERAGAGDALVCVDAQHARALAARSLPLLAVGPRVDGERPLARGPLLVALDGSVEGEAALPLAMALASCLGAALSLAHVSGPTGAGGEWARPGDRLPSNYLARAAAAAARAGGVEVDWDVLHGDVVSALTAQAASASAGLIALNGRSGGGGRHGGLAARLVARSPVPVLLTWRPPRPVPASPVVSRPRPTPPARHISAAPRRPVRDVVLLPDAARLFRDRLPEAGGARPAAPPVEERRSTRGLGAATGVVGAIAAIVVAVVLVVPRPYYALSGRIIGAARMVSVTGHDGHGRPGGILVTYVASRPMSRLAAGWASWWGRREVWPRPPAPTAQAERRLGAQQMTAAERTAVAVVLRRFDVDTSVDQIRTSAAGLGGPSAGLAIALQTVDDLADGRLVRGRRVAVTGALDEDGRVLPVGAVAYKARAASRAGASLMLVPRADWAEALAAAPKLRVVPVTTFAEALAALES